MEKIKNITRIFDCKQDSVALFDLDGTLLDGDLGETSYYVMMLLAAKGDELLDWRLMQSHYSGARQVITDGGDHGLSDFELYLEQVLSFCGI